MKKWAYYNDVDPVACEVVRDLIRRGVVCDGEVDSRSIKEVSPEDVKGFTQKHFFCGAATWSVAARMAGWPDDLDLWTASAPCQPFSAAGKGRGVDDPRHLWPDLFRLVRACRLGVVVGEQVSGKVGYGWLDGVRADLEAEGYAVEAVDIPASAVDAPHQRNRLYWVAVAHADDRGRGRRAENALGLAERRNAAERAVEPMEHAESFGRDERRAEHELWGWRDAAAEPNGAKPMGDADAARLAIRRSERSYDGAQRSAAERANGSFWSGAEWIECADGKARRTPRAESYFRHVAHELSAGIVDCDPARLLVPSFKGRSAAWKLAGNAIVAALAAEVLAALLDTLGESE